MNNLVVNTRSAAGTTIQNGATLPDADLFFALSGGNGLTDMGAGPTGGSVARGNLFAPANQGPGYVLMAGGGGRMAIDAATAQYPQLFSKNVNARPVFVAKLVPYRWGISSCNPQAPGWAEGYFSRQPQHRGTPTVFPCTIAASLMAGCSAPGDTIQLQGTKQKATVVGIDRAANILTLSVPLAFSDGQGVALAYAGAAPDIGAPVGSTDARRPLAPSGVTVTSPCPASHQSL